LKEGWKLEKAQKVYWGAPRLDGARGKKQVWRHMLNEPKVFREQMYCTEDCSCDIVGTSRCIVPACPPRYAPEGLQENAIYRAVDFANAKLPSLKFTNVWRSNFFPSGQACTTQKARRAKLIKKNFPRAAKIYFVVQ